MVTEHDSSDRPPLLFLHLRKCGGTTLQKLIQSRFVRGEICWPYVFPEVLNLPRSEVAGKKYFRGHLPYDFVSYPGPDLFKITFLREPTDRLVSFYYYVRRREQETFYELANDLPLIDFYQNERVIAEVSNEMTRQLGSRNSLDHYRTYWQAKDYSLDLALERLRTIEVVGIAEKFWECVDYMTWVLDWPPIHHRSRDNVTGFRRNTSELSSEELDVLRGVSTQDEILYEKALELVEARLEHMRLALLDDFRLTHSPKFANSYRTIRLDLSESVNGAGWSFPARTDTGTGYRWVDTRSDTYIDIPLEIRSPLTVRFQIVNQRSRNLVDALRLLVNGEPLLLRREYREDDVLCIAQVSLATLQINRRFTRFQFQVDADLGGSSKSVGIALFEVLDANIEVIRAADKKEYFAQVSVQALDERLAVESALLHPRGEDFQLRGYCQICDSETEFSVSMRNTFSIRGVTIPNWRENLVCGHCRMGGRQRNTLWSLQNRLRVTRPTRLYVTEQNSKICRWLRANVDHLTESCFLAATLPSGWRSAAGLCHQDLTKTSFDDESFEGIASYDVLEHIPDFEDALREMHRILRVGGWLHLTAPFSIRNDSNVLRARVLASGEVEHLHPPEYHHDPNNPQGCLAYHTFGWELLNQITDCGFSNVQACVTWDREFGCLGEGLVIIEAEKSIS